MITVYGKVTEIEPTAPPAPEPPPEPPPELPLGLEGLRRQAGRAAPEPREGEEVAKSWVHVHITLDAPHSGEITVEVPETQVGGMLVVDGRARVMLASN